MAGDADSSIIEEEALDWFTRLREPADDSVRAEFALWRLADPAHARAYDELLALWGNVYTAVSTRDEAAALDLAPPIRHEVRGRYRRAASWGGGLTIAASWALYALAAPPGGISALLADARTAPGETRELTLPDGTRIRLASGSAIDYDITARERKVRLISGHAFFEIRPEHARPFQVETGDALIRDIGTAFEVARQGDRSSVAVESGMVEVTLENGRAAMLGAGQKIGFSNTFTPLRAVAPADVAAWRDHRLLFDGTPLLEVLSELEANGAGSIVLLDRTLGEKRLTGSFDTRRPREALDSIARIIGARVTRLGPITLVRAR